MNDQLTQTTTEAPKIEQAAATDTPVQEAQNPLTSQPVDVQQPTVVSSDIAKSITDKNKEVLTQKIDQISQPTAVKSETPTTQNKPAQTTEVQAEQYDYGDNYQGLSKQEQDIQSQIDEQKQEIVSFFDSYARKVDATTRATVNEITKTYERRSDAQKEINKRTLKMLNVIGYTSGRSRYMPTLQSNILAEEERAGQDRLKEIDREKLSLIAQAKAAGDEKSFAVMQQKMQQLQQKDIEEKQLLTELNKVAIEKEKAIQEQLKNIREEEKFMLDYSIKISDAVSGAIASSLEGLSPEDQQQYVLQQARNLGIDGMILAGAVVDAQRKQQVDNLNILNTQSLISSREFGDQLAAERFNLDTFKANQDRVSTGFKVETDLRKEFTSLEPVKQYQEVQGSFNRINTAYEDAISSQDGESRAAADQALIVSFNKMLDPGSVVREGEYARSEQGQSLLNRAVGWLERLSKGGTSLTDSERAQIVDATQRMYQDYLKTYNDDVDYYRDLAAQQGASPDNVAQYSGFPLKTIDQLDTLLKKPGLIVELPDGSLLKSEGSDWITQDEFDPLFGFNPGSVTLQNGNLPQRNNNPGNVKIGGIADQYALKDSQGRPRTDEQGHLIFASPQDGLKGVQADIDAKVEGRSNAAKSKLGKQVDTISELNLVYAEDPNWKNNVVSQLKKLGYNVTINTNVRDIPRDALYQAIFISEGYYA